MLNNSYRSHGVRTASLEDIAAHAREWLFEAAAHLWRAGALWRNAALSRTHVDPWREGIPVRIACSSRPATSTPIASSAGWAGGPDYASEATALTNLLSKTKVSAIALTICSHSNVRGPRPIRDAPVKQRHCNLVHQRSSPKPLRCRTLQNDCDCRARHASQRHVKRGRNVGSPRGDRPSACDAAGRGQ